MKQTPITETATHSQIVGTIRTVVQSEDSYPGSIRWEICLEGLPFVFRSGTNPSYNFLSDLSGKVVVLTIRKSNGTVSAWDLIA